MCGLMLKDGNLRLFNGRKALLSILVFSRSGFFFLYGKNPERETHSELVIDLWNISNTLNLVTTPVKTMLTFRE